MNWLTQFGLHRSRLTVLIMIGLITLGSILYSSFPKREDPEILIRQAVVTVTFAGMTPERLENLIAAPVERKIREIPEVKELRTLVTTGRVKIDVVVKDRYSDLDPIWQELRDKMEEIARELPSGAKGPFVNTNFADVSIASIAMSAEGFSFREMELAAESLQRYLYTLDGVSKVDLYGVQDERIWLEVDTERLAAIGIQLDTLIRDLTQQNTILPAGTLNAGGQSILLEASGDFTSVEEISRMLTKVEGLNDFVRLGDIVTVRRGLVSPRVKPVYFNGRPAVVISVQMQSAVDIEALGEQLSRAVETFEQSLPIGFELSFAAFQPKNVTDAVDNAVSNVVQTFTVVLLVMMLFLGLRSGLIIASIVPFAMMFALIGMSLLHIDLEQVSIAAIIISLGLLVDNGVVIVEDIIRRLQSGESMHNAALRAGGQFALPLLVSSLTTIFAFTPFFLLQGNEGEYSFSLGAVVAMTLLGSWISAIYFLPFISKHALARANHRNHRKSQQLSLLDKLYAKVLAKSQRLALWIIIVCYAAVVGAVMLLSRVPNEMFPLSDRHQVLIYQNMPKGTDISATQESALAIGRWINNPEHNPQVKNHVLYVGSGGPRFYLALNPADTAPETAFFLVNTQSLEGALSFAKRAKRYLLEHHPEARFKIKRLSMGASESGTVEVKISGPQLDRLLAMAGEVEAMFRDAPDINQNENDWGEKIVKVLIDIDQDKARRTGISSESMAQLLSAYFDGYAISDYREADQSIPIVLRAAERSRDSVEDLMNIVLGDGTGTMALEQVAKLRPMLEYSQIRRLDQIRTIKVTAKSDSLTAEQLLQTVQSRLDALDLSGGYQLEIGGELADSSDINGKLGAGLPIAFLMMLAVIVFQFNSFRRALMVFMTVPLIVIGVPLGLLLAGEPMSFFGTLGLISLAGIIINNAIVLIDQVDIERKTLPVKAAISAAATKRLRPILLTSATTVIGLLPLYLFGGALWTPLAVVMMSGLAVASLATLVFVPASYQLLFRD